MFYKGGAPSQNFKNIFTNIARARAFLSDKLPRKMLVQINLKTLKFADPKFIASIPPAERAADVLFSVEAKSGQDGYIFIYLEGGSSRQTRLVLCLWEYQLCILDAYMKKTPPNLPLIIPFIFAYGSAEWTGPRSIGDIFGVSDAELSEYIKATVKKQMS